MLCLRNIRRLAVTVTVLSLVSLSARAEEGGLPQLDTNLFPEQLFWLAVSFLLLYVLMSLVALPRVARTQSSRRHIVEGEVEAARLASEAAKQSVALIEKSLNEARATAHASVSDMMDKVAKEAAARQTAQQKDILRRLNSSEAIIAEAREAALKSINGTAQELAVATIEKIIGAKLKVGA